jgi:RNA polymerase sigma-70 factor (ECF subfamily)
MIDKMTKEEFYTVVEKAKGGDTDAFRVLVENKISSILLQAENMLGNAQDAEDAAQEIVLALYNNISNLRDIHVFNAWLSRIIINTCNSFLSAKKRRNEHVGAEEYYMEAVDDDRDFLPAAYLEEKESYEQLRHIVEHLPARRRAAIKMYYYDEMTYAEIARAMNVTISAVSTYILKAKKQIKKKYERYSDPKRMRSHM